MNNLVLPPIVRKEIINNHPEGFKYNKQEADPIKIEPNFLPNMDEYILEFNCKNNVISKIDNLNIDHFTWRQKNGKNYLGEYSLKEVNEKIMSFLQGSYSLIKLYAYKGQYSIENESVLNLIPHILFNKRTFPARIKFSDKDYLTIPSIKKSYNKACRNFRESF